MKLYVPLLHYPFNSIAPGYFFFFYQKNQQQQQQQNFRENILDL